jgi:hypothetical protein
MVKAVAVNVNQTQQKEEDNQPNSLFGWVKAGASSLFKSVIGSVSARIGRVAAGPEIGADHDVIDFEKEAANLTSSEMPSIVKAKSVPVALPKYLSPPADVPI